MRTNESIQSVTVVVQSWKNLENRKDISILDVWIGIHSLTEKLEGDLAYHFMGTGRRDNVRICVFSQIDPRYITDELMRIAFLVGFEHVEYYHGN